MTLSVVVFEAVTWVKSMYLTKSWFKIRKKDKMWKSKIFLHKYPSDSVKLHLRDGRTGMLSVRPSVRVLDGVWNERTDGRTNKHSNNVHRDRRRRQSMWAERSGKISRSSLSSIYGSPAPLTLHLIFWTPLTAPLRSFNFLTGSAPQQGLI